jgi:hypothetical protein
VRCFVCRFIKKIIARVIDPLVASSSLDGAFLPQIAPWSTRAFNLATSSASHGFASRRLVTAISP